jgi:hypothetical protein
MRTFRLLVPAALAVGLLPFVAAPATAAAPANDEPAGAVQLHLGARVEQDTTAATTNEQDAALNASCGAPATNASVWYTYSPSVDRSVVLDMTESDYSGGFLVFRGTPTADSLVTCGPGIVGLRARAGETYYIMVISDTETNGGNLVLTLKRAVVPRVRMSLAGRAVVFHGGAARIHGSYRCSRSDSAYLSARLFQRAGRLKIEARTDQEVQCDGSRHRWSARLVSPVGTYAAGHARARATITACGTVVCRHDTARRRVHLVWAPRASSPRSMPSSASRAPRPRPLVARQRY